MQNQKFKLRIKVYIRAIMKIVNNKISMEKIRHQIKILSTDIIIISSFAEFKVKIFFYLLSLISFLM